MPSGEQRVPHTDVPLLTKDTIDAHVAALRPQPVPVPELRYGPEPVLPQFTACRIDDTRFVNFKQLTCGNESPEQRRQAVVERMQRMSHKIRNHHGLEEFSRLDEVSQDERVYLGIVQSCGMQDGVLSCVVDGLWSPELAYGCNIHLRLEGLAALSLYPGKIFAFRGKNVGSTIGSFPVIMVTEVYEAPLLPPASQAQATAMVEGAEAEGTIRMVVACGPYGPDAGHTVLAIQELVDFAVRKRQASCIVLCGPFLSEPPAGVVPEHLILDDEFYGISEKLSVICNRFPGLQLILVPCLRDVAAENVFPQPQFDVTYDSTGIIGVGNPTTFTVNGAATIAVSTNPIMEHLNRVLQESGVASDVPRMKRVAHTLLQAHSVYPLLPPAPDAQLNYDFLKHCEFTSASPDILLLPSRLPAFAHRVGDSVVVNPGFYSRREFAEVTIIPGTPIVAERTSVEIFKSPPVARP